MLAISAGASSSSSDRKTAPRWARTDLGGERIASGLSDHGERSTCTAERALVRRPRPTDLGGDAARDGVSMGSEDILSVGGRRPRWIDLGGEAGVGSESTSEPVEDCKAGRCADFGGEVGDSILSDGALLLPMEMPPQLPPQPIEAPAASGTNGLLLMSSPGSSEQGAGAGS